ncbi:MAG: cation diffusion facilitator family transporter [Oscillospiraceae bacterium]|jgi:cation diffusion facilitator family transporter|nr:cation diffusion facilitator family transporter [Oscillospiraceae bacterium]
MLSLFRCLIAGSSAEEITPAARTRIGVMGSALGAVVNLALAVGKFIAGNLSHSVAVTADAMNNLTDAGSALISAVGTKMAGKSADAEHPFGHGRMEYLVTVFFSVLVLFMGWQMGRNSLERIFAPTPVSFGWVPVGIVAGSIFCKVGLGFFYRRLGKRTDAPALLAAAQDSFSDTLCSGVTLLSLVLARFTGVPLDGYFGAVVALFIFWSGGKMLLETLGTLVGERPSGDLPQRIHDILIQSEGIVGVHDMMLHNYGPGRIFGSAHAEVPADVDVMISHEHVDAAEKRIFDVLAIPFVLHMDPIALHDARISAIYDAVKALVKATDPTLSLHDFRVVDGEKRINLIFDLVVPHDTKPEKARDLEQTLCTGISALDPRYNCVITVENSFI